MSLHAVASDETWTRASLKQAPPPRSERVSGTSAVPVTPLRVLRRHSPFGKLTVDFRTSPTELESVAKPLVLQALADAGMRIDDLEDWKLEIGAKTISLSGNLTTSGLRRALVVIESPTTSDSTADEVKSQSAEKTLSAEAKASQDHYRTVVGMFDDLPKITHFTPEIAPARPRYYAIVNPPNA